MNYQIDANFLVLKIVDVIKFVVEAVFRIHTCPVLLLTAILGMYEARALKIKKKRRKACAYTRKPE